MPDFRGPDSVRLGLVPLYTSHAEVVEALGRMRELVASGRYREVESAAFARDLSVPPGINPQGGISTLADAATAELRERILSGELASGTPLRLEELARSLGMSISPIREAVRKLETLGLAEHVAHRGSRVTLLTVDDLRDTYEARYALEPLAIERAAARITAAEVATARAALDALHGLLRARRPRRRPRARTTRSTSRSTRPRARTGSCGLIRPAWENSERYRALAMPDLEMIRAREHEHQRILDACAAGDAATASAELRAPPRGDRALRRRPPDRAAAAEGGTPAPR